MFARLFQAFVYPSIVVYSSHDFSSANLLCIYSYQVKFNDIQGYTLIKIEIYID